MNLSDRIIPLRQTYACRLPVYAHHIALRFSNLHSNSCLDNDPVQDRFPITVYVDDLIEAESVKEDCDGDGVFENEVPASDYALFPPDARPKTPGGRPYYALKRVIRRDVGEFPVGVASVEIGGFWGYRDYTVPLGIYTAMEGSALTKASQSVKVDDDRNVNPGETVYLEDEQMFVRTC